MDLADRYRGRPVMGFIRAMLPVIDALAKRHPLRLDGMEHLPDGPVLLVGNHGLYGYETPFFFRRLFELTGDVPLGLADRWFFNVPILRDVLIRVGGTYGSPKNAELAFAEGRKVVCYPGGAREVFKCASDRYKLQWEHCKGFVKVAQRAGVPIVPFAAAGVDDIFEIPNRWRGSGQFLMGDAKYDLPLIKSPVPKAVPLWFRLGKPVRVSEGDSIDDAHAAIWQNTQTLLDDLLNEWREVS